MKFVRNSYYFLFGAVGSLLITPLTVKGYDFGDDSGIQETAEGTGHTEMGLFTPGNLPSSIGTLINAALSFLGVLFLLLTIYGGYLWMTAAGNEEQINKAKKIITSALIGLIIVISAYIITKFLT